MTLRLLPGLLLLASITATSSSAQPLEASTPEAAWLLVRDLPLSTRLTLNTAEQEFEATLAAIRDDELVVTDASLQKTLLRQSTGTPSGFIVPRATVTGARVKKLGNTYKAAPGASSNPVTVRHVLGTIGRRTVVEIRTAAPQPIIGQIASVGDTSVTVLNKKKLTDVSLQDIRGVRGKPPISGRDVAFVGALIGGLVVLSAFLSQYAD